MTLDKVDYCQDLIEGTDFKDKKEWDCLVFRNIGTHTTRISEKICRQEFVKTFYGLSQPLTKKESFTFNDEHNEVIVDMKSYEKDFQVFDFLFGDRSYTKRYCPRGYSEDDLRGIW